MSVLIQQLAAAWQAVSELQQLGVHVVSVRCSPLHDEARVHVMDPGNLLDHLDVQSIDTTAVRYCERGVRLHGCVVYWLLGLDAPRDQLAEGWPFPERKQ